MTKRKYSKEQNREVAKSRQMRSQRGGQKSGQTSAQKTGPKSGGDQPQKFQTVTKARPRPGRSVAVESGSHWIFGHHVVIGALANAKREVRRVLITSDEANPDQTGRARPVQVEKVPKSELDRLLPPGAVHQGIASQVTPLKQPRLETLLAIHADQPRATILLLDQVTDPRNVGAILRSAAAFDATAVVMTERNAPPESGTLAKAASGALELVPLVKVTNLARALDTLATAGFWRIGLDGNASETVTGARDDGRRVLVLGAEGKGLRRLTTENCDQLVRLPISKRIDSLNVSNAAAIALFALARR